MGKTDKSKAKDAHSWGPLGSPFAALDALRDKLPSVPVPPAPTAAPPPAKAPARAVVRYERKGHGGKQVTLVEKLELSATDLEDWCKELKQTLGCGGTVDGDAIVLQGDLRTRLPKVLTEKGVSKVTVSG
ncbi:MAG: translation initiation factor [Deltaproteobacteria bacterium]|nr:translation initiation factor [Deltaproteobacteria bacterium]